MNICATHLLRSWKHRRGLVFLDPFGMQVPWSTIELLAKTKAIEVFINFPVSMAIQRLLRRDARFSNEQRARIDLYLGSPNWFDVVYQKGTGLFGETVDKAADSKISSRDCSAPFWLSFTEPGIFKCKCLEKAWC